MISSEALLLLLGVVIASSVVSISLIGVSNNIADSVEDTEKSTVSNIDEDVKIVDDLSTSISEGATTTIHVQNTGGGIIPKDSLRAFVNGQPVPISSSSVNNGDTWSENKILVLEIKSSISGDAVVGVRTSNADDSIKVSEGGVV